jgi:hypothetical protein
MNQFLISMFILTYALPLVVVWGYVAYMSYIDRKNGVDNPVSDIALALIMGAIPLMNVVMMKEALVDLYEVKQR